MAAYVSLCETVPFGAVIRALLPTAGGVYVTFLFGAFVGELSLRFGLVVFALAGVVLVMVQAVFASYRQLVESEKEVLEGMVNAVERKDPYTAGHSKRVVKFVGYVGEKLGYKGRALTQLEQHALMHDIGKIVVPNRVLCKPGKLDPDERELMFRHEPAGAAILGAVPFLAVSADIAQGRGHKGGFDGEVRAAHIVHAADAFDAMTSTRPYRRAHPQQAVFEEMYAKAGKDFHPQCVDALYAAIHERGEVYGEGHEEHVASWATPPPVGKLGSTLADEAKADGQEVAEPEAHPIAHERKLSRDRVVLGGCAIVALVAGIAAAGLGVEHADLVSLGALVALGEMVALRPWRRVARPLSLVVMLVALSTTSFVGASTAIGAGILMAALLRAEPRLTGARGALFGKRLVVACAATTTYWAFAELGSGTVTVAGTLATLIASCLLALAFEERLEVRGRIRLDVRTRLAELALLTCGPLVALGTAGTDATPGLGLGSFAVLMVPLALLTHGYIRTERAHQNLFAWVRAVSIAPQFAGLVGPGRAGRVAENALALADRVGIDAMTRDQLEVAAWMECVGACCIDDPDDRAAVIETSASILESSAFFVPAARILRGTCDEDPESLPSRVLLAAIAREDASGEGAALPDLNEFALLVPAHQAPVRAAR
jgi:hypothetical protein